MPHPLTSLTLPSSEKLPGNIYVCGLLFDAVAEGSLGNLRRLKVSENVWWSDGLAKKELAELNDLLEALGTEDGKGELAGVWEYKEGR